MALRSKYQPFFVAALLLYVVLIVIYPYYRYYIDPDGVAYVTISRRYAAGDMQKSINGYWSPWSCWLTALLIRQHVQPMTSALVVNIIGATGVLFITQAFFLKFGVFIRMQWALLGALALFLCYAIFWQSFDDIWECFFLLSALRVMIADAFPGKPLYWILCGFIGTMAYFAKAYSFPFFILNVVCCTWLICGRNLATWTKMNVIIIGVLVLGAMPWIAMLHNKYHEWFTSTAGPLNLSWYLTGHQNWLRSIRVLVPPVYADSPFNWEDPWYSNAGVFHFWDSWHLFGLQLIRIVMHAGLFLLSIAQLSVFFPVIFGAAIFPVLFKRRAGLYVGNTKVVALSMILFPLGYLLITYEPRYLWYMVPLSMVLGVRLIHMITSYKWRTVVMALFPLSFLVYPLFCMAKMYRVGEDDYRAAQQLMQFGIHGSFTSMAKPGDEAHHMQRIAFYSGCQFYSLTGRPYTHEDILSDIRRYHVQYFFVYDGSAAFTLDEAKSFPEITHGRIPGLKVYQVNP